MKKRTVLGAILLPVVTAAALAAGCSPTVKVEAPDKPIVINMNIKIDHEIRVKVDRELDSLLDTKKGLF
ncbi:MAG: YnbE family lipoprotein [Chlorobi bacterium]|nr:YnbE family lipoprotein [Chlorobiota bacterium]MBM3423779.1 YnbE family lipoprotein [Chlorobiota bacterium]